MVLLVPGEDLLDEPLLVGGHDRVLDPVEVDRIKRSLGKEKSEAMVEERIRPTVVRRKRRKKAAEAQPPGSVAELTLALKGTPAFLASFASIASMWYAHHQWSRRYGLEDGVSVLISLVLISAGLASSSLHLANPKNAWRAFFRFKTSWLSREAALAAEAAAVHCVVHPVQAAQEGGLAAARRADQRDHLVPADIQVDVVDGALVAIIHVDLIATDTWVVDAHFADGFADVARDRGGVRYRYGVLHMAGVVERSRAGRGHGRSLNPCLCVFHCFHHMLFRFL